jgi:polyisoprenoid-binding protein YceI
MATWILEPGHTEAEFKARHMMVTWVRGLFKDIHGRLELDWDHCLDATFEGEIDATAIWTGEPTCAAPTSSTSTTTLRSASAAASPSARPRPLSRARSS